MNFRRFLPLLWGGVLAAAAACAQPVSTLYDKAEYRIAMRDSVRLHTSVYTPKAPGRAPIIISARLTARGPTARTHSPPGSKKATCGAMSIAAISSSSRTCGGVT